MKSTKLNNKGFSLVELIIVITIMAVLVGALAPALIRYVGESRRSTDVNNASTIATAVTCALNDADAYEELVMKATQNNSATVTFDLDSANDCIQTNDSIGSSFDKIIKESISGGIKQMAVKSKTDPAGNAISATDFTITVDTSNNSVTVNIGNIECYPESSGMK